MASEPDIISSLLSGLIGAIIGSIVGLIGGIILQNRRFKSEDKRRETEINDQINAVKISIGNEITALRDIYRKTAGDKFEEEYNEKKAFMFPFSITQDYTTIYSSNGDKIGMIPDDEIRLAIISAYSSGRGLIDAYNANNRILSEYNKYDWLYKTTSTKKYQTYANEISEQLIKYTKHLKNMHDTFISNVDVLEEKLGLSEQADSTDTIWKGIKTKICGFIVGENAINNVENSKQSKKKKINKK